MIVIINKIVANNITVNDYMECIIGINSNYKDSVY